MIYSISLIPRLGFFSPPFTTEKTKLHLRSENHAKMKHLQSEGVRNLFSEKWDAKGPVGKAGDPEQDPVWMHGVMQDLHRAVRNPVLRHGVEQNLRRSHRVARDPVQRHEVTQDAEQDAMQKHW